MFRLRLLLIRFGKWRTRTFDASLVSTTRAGLVTSKGGLADMAITSDTHADWFLYSFADGRPDSVRPIFRDFNTVFSASCLAPADKAAGCAVTGFAVVLASAIGFDSLSGSVGAAASVTTAAAMGVGVITASSVGGGGGADVGAAGVAAAEVEATGTGALVVDDSAAAVSVVGTGFLLGLAPGLISFETNRWMLFLLDSFVEDVG